MAFIWFVIWLIANNVGGQEALTMDPVNTWAATLILALRSRPGRVACKRPRNRVLRRAPQPGLPRHSGSMAPPCHTSTRRAADHRGVRRSDG